MFAAHIVIEPLRLEQWLDIAVYTMAAVGILVGVFTVRHPATGDGRKISRAGVAAVATNVLLVALTITYSTALLALPPHQFQHKVGDALTEFEQPLVDAEGGLVTLADLRGETTLLMFYRGGFCPYCRAQLTGLHERFDEISEGARILAVSPDLSDTVKQYASRFKLGFTLLSDEGTEVAMQYGLAHDDPFHGKVSLPATILLDRDGRVAWYHIADDIGDRPSPDEILQQVELLSQSAP